MGDDVKGLRRRRFTHCALPMVAAGLLAASAAVAISASSPRAGATAGRLHIHELRGSLVKVGSSGPGGAGYDLLGVRLRAIVCLRSAAAAMNAYPSEIGVTHYAVSKPPRRWWPARTVIDRAPWLVPVGETWGGKACGPVWVSDPIPATHYGVESLGNPDNCYGVALTIKIGATRAMKRAIVRCPFGS
jgi:hypothetical protein